MIMTKKLKFWRYILDEAVINPEVLLAAHDIMNSSWGTCLIGEFVSLNEHKMYNKIHADRLNHKAKNATTLFYIALRHKNTELLRVAIEYIESLKTVFK